MGGVGLDWSDPEQGQVAGSCYRDNESSVSISAGNFMTSLDTISL
jgi:hypothetical protein